MLLPALILALGVAPQAAPPQLAVRAVRFYLPGSQETSVLALVQVPYVLAEPAGNRIAWRTKVSVADKDGTVLLDEGWWSGAPASFRVPDAYGMEPLRIPLKSGNYTLKVTVTDSVSGRTATVTTPIAGFERQPELSDLLLANSMRVVASNDTTSLPGEVARGSMRFTTAPTVTLNALTPMLAFMLEAYSPVEAVASTELTVLSRDGKDVIYKLAPFEQTVPVGGGVIRGQFALDGLGQGNYLLKASVSIAGSSVERTAPFEVGSLQKAMARDLARRNAEKGIDEAWFGAMSEDDLDAAEEVLTLIAKKSELAPYKARGDGALTVKAKRQFLVQFWQQRDKTPDTPVNEARIRFYDAIDYANQQYAEAGRNARPGWKTDRGQIFVKHGRPQEDQSFRPQGAPPFEIWRYTTGRSTFYIFADRNNLGNFELIKTNDLNETSAPNWCELLNPLVVRRDIEPFLGQQFLISTGGGGMEGSAQRLACR